MVPHDDFTPHGYLDNPYHCWKLNPSGVLRSLAPLGMGWHVPNLGSYVRNQFQYTAHLSIGLKVGELVLVTPEDFAFTLVVGPSPRCPRMVSLCLFLGERDAKIGFVKQRFQLR